MASPEAALAEAARILAPSGRQDRLDRIWSRMAGGCHFNRTTDAAVERSGFTFTRIRRFDFRLGLPALLVRPHLIATAIVPQH